MKITLKPDFWQYLFNSLYVALVIVTSWYTTSSRLLVLT